MGGRPVMTGDGAAMRQQLEDREAECRMLRERCEDLERLLAAEQTAMQVVFAAGEANARTRLGFPTRPHRRRTHLRALSAVVLFMLLTAVAFHTAVHTGLRPHPARRTYAAASQPETVITST